jgi:hypothetical protein
MTVAGEGVARLGTDGQWHNIPGSESWLVRSLATATDTIFVAASTMIGGPVGLWRYDGTWHADHAPVIAANATVRARSPSDAYAVLDTSLLHWDGSTWVPVDVSSVCPTGVSDVGLGGPHSIVVVCANSMYSTVWFDGTSWALAPAMSGSYGTLRPVGPLSGSSNLVFGGDPITVRTLSADAWTTGMLVRPADDVGLGFATGIRAMGTAVDGYTGHLWRSNGTGPIETLDHWLISVEYTIATSTAPDQTCWTNGRTFVRAMAPPIPTTPSAESGTRDGILRCDFPSD